MKRYVKAILWLSAAIGACLALILILLLLAPTFVNIQTFKEKILTEFSRTIEGAVEAERIDLSFFPRPSVTLQAGKIEIPQKVSVAFASLSVYPEIGALLRGRVRISRLALVNPQMQAGLPDNFEKMGGLDQFSLKAIDDELASIVTKAVSQAPGLVVSVEKGSLTLIRQKKPAFWFHDIEARLGLPGKRVNVELRCSSNVWKQLSLAAWLRPGELKNEGHLQVVQLRPDLILQNLFPHAEPRIEESPVNVNISFGADGMKSSHADFECDAPVATLRKGNQAITLKEVSLKATLRQDGDKTTASLTQLKTVYPQLTLSGSLTSDAASKEASLELNSSAVDVESVRAATLFFAGEIPDVRSVFDVLRKGRVSAMSITSRAHALGDLTKEENFVIRGKMTQGNIYIREKQLDIQEAKGNAVISNGILEGSDLEGRLGDAKGTGGRLKIDFKPDLIPFRVDIMIQKANLAHLPFYLRNLVENEALTRELDLIHEIRGDGSGRLVLDRSGKDIQVIVDVTTFSLHALYKRFPYPLEVSGKFSYDDAAGKIRVADLAGKAGQSSFSKLTAELGLDEKRGFAVTSGTASAVLEEIYPWLMSFEPIKDALKKVESAKNGIINLNGMQVKGLLSQPESWQFQVGGSVQNVTLTSPELPVSFEFASGTFEAKPEQLSFSSVLTRFQDSSLTVSGTLNNYLKGLDRVDLSVEGELGEQSHLRVSDLVAMPRELRTRSPLSMSQTRVLWEKNGKKSLSGNLQVRNGPALSLDALSEHEELVIKRLVIKDAKSDATLSLQLKGRKLDLTFDGSLAGPTLDSLLENNTFLTGWIKGKMSSHIDLDQPFDSSAQGELQGAGLHYAYKGKDPVKVDTFSIGARGKLFTVDSNLLVLEYKIKTKGEVDFKRDGFVFDMGLSLDGFDVDRFIAEVLARTEEGSIGNLPVKGTLRVESEYVKYHGFTWRPVSANIIFDPHTISIGITQANLCAINTLAILNIHPDGLELRTQPIAKDQDLHETLVCLSDTKDASGRFTLNGDVSGKGKAEALFQSLKGTIEFEAKNGRIARYGLISKIFEVLSPTGFLNIADLRKEGFAYYTIRAKANMENGKIAIKEALVDAPSTDLVFNGEINVMDKKIDAVVLVVPFRTIDRVISFIPLVRYVMANRLVAIPVRVTGDVDNPDVMPFPPRAVGAGLLDMVGRFFKLPFEVIQPLLPGEEKKSSP